jgi:hypothetical protein
MSDGKETGTGYNVRRRKNNINNGTFQRTTSMYQEKARRNLRNDEQRKIKGIT